MEFSILMPCLNEEKTLPRCMEKALIFCTKNELQAEIVVVDNGSTDRSWDILQEYTQQYPQIRGVKAENRGYGNAILAGIKSARGKYIIMADADDSYDFLEMNQFVEALRAGNQLVIGNRFAGKMEKGAMPFLHKYIGNPLLSWIGRKLFHSEVQDFHCGMRGFHRETIENLQLQCEDMEFASEMIAKAETAGFIIAQVPVKLHPDGRQGNTHLRTFYHGYRHLHFLFGYADARKTAKQRQGANQGQAAKLDSVEQTKGAGFNTKRYLITFFICAATLISLLYVTSYIPNRALKSNLIETVTYWQEEEALFYNLYPKADFTKIDNYADSILLNIMYHMDGTHRVESLLRASYYRADEMNAVQSLAESLKEEKEVNVTYERYWHGMQVILRPLFSLFSIVQIRIFFGIVLGTLLLGLLFELYRKKMWVENGSILVAFLLVCGFVIPFCIEYVSTWIIAFAISWMVLKWEAKSTGQLGQLFIISGICTAFFDFLTTETITLLLPLILFLGTRAKAKDTRNITKTTLQYGILWGGSYVGMWASKWLLSAMVLGGERVSEVGDNIGMRLYGKIVGLQFAQYLEAPFRNLADLLVFSNTKTYLQVLTPTAIVLFIFFTIFYFFHRPWKEQQVSLLLLLLGLVPIARFMILNNHSYIHHFFTYRIVFATIIAWSMALYYGCRFKKENIAENSDLEKI